MARGAVVASVMLALLVVGCVSPGSSPGPSGGTNVVSPVPVTASPTIGPTPTPPPTAPPSAPALVASSLPVTAVDIIGLDGTVLLAEDETYTPFLYDLADGSLTQLAFGTEPRAWDLGERGVLMSVPDADGRQLTPMLYDRATGNLVELEVAASAIDGSRIAGVRDLDRIYLYDLDAGRMVMTSDVLRRRDRVVVSALSGHLMVGTYGEFDAEQAWIYDIDAGTLVDVNARLGDPRNSWGYDVDGDLVVGAYEVMVTLTPLHVENRAFVYDVASDTLTDLEPLLDGSSIAHAVDGDVVVGSVQTGVEHPYTYSAFAYDVRTGELVTLPAPEGSSAPGQVEARQVSGRLVVGRSGSSLVSWTLPRGW